MGCPGRIFSDNPHVCKKSIQGHINGARFNDARWILDNYGSKLLDNETCKNFSKRIDLAEDAYVGFKSVPKRLKFNLSQLLKKLIFKK